MLVLLSFGINVFALVLEAENVEQIHDLPKARNQRVFVRGKDGSSRRGTRALTRDWGHPRVSRE